MCLYTTLDKPLIAEEDIICYKFYDATDSKNICSPYRYVKAPEIGVTATTKLGIPVKVGRTINEVNEGFHSFKHLKDIKSNIGFMYSISDIRRIFKLFKCIIPKGSLYYTGSFGDSESYCSESIKLI